MEPRRGNAAAADDKTPAGAAHERIAAWSRAAAREIRFRPDRKAVEAELSAHLEDRAQALLASGMGEDEAAEVSVAAMGDAREIGRALSRIHSPLLGWLWVASKWLVVSALCFLLLAARADWLASGFLEGSTSLEWSGAQLLKLPAAEPVRAGDYRISVRRAAFRNGVLWVTVRAAGAPWLGAPKALASYLGAADSLGGVYGENTDENGAAVRYAGERRALFWYEYDVTVSPCPADAAWVELRYDRMGVRFALCVPLSEGGEP
ncbi:MAG TPA: permease prefix domain 1-containing protein [Oscillospiraceae bacterium]|nr:permease prefix domain 1-containing protein [Oscillospiraceae bacterium]